jgi:hypothetical protein
MDSWNRLDGIIVLMSYAGHAVFLMADWTSASSITSLRSARLLKLYKIIRLLKTLRVLRSINSFSSGNTKLQALMATLASMETVFKAMFRVILIITYFFAATAHQLFRHNDSVVQIPHENSTALPDESSCDWCPGFNSFGLSLLTYFQMMVVADWSKIMYTAMDGTSWLACLVFVSYIILVSIILTQLLGALVLEIYQLENARSKKAASGTDVEEKQRLFPNKHLEWSQDEEREQRLQVVLSEGIAREFEKVDVDNSGFISRDELTGLLLKMRSHQHRHRYQFAPSVKKGTKSNQIYPLSSDSEDSVQQEVDQLMKDVSSTREHATEGVGYEEFQVSYEYICNT